MGMSTTSHSAAYVPRPYELSSVAKVERNILQRRAGLPLSVVRREAESLVAASAEADGVKYRVRGGYSERDFNRLLDGSMSLPWDAVLGLPDQGSAGARVYVALVTPGLRDCSHSATRDASGDHGVDAAHAAFFDVTGDYTVAYVNAKADGHLSDDERRQLDRLLTGVIAWATEARASVRRG